MSGLAGCVRDFFGTRIPVGTDDVSFPGSRVWFAAPADPRTFGPMDLRPLGRTGLRVSVVGFGGSPLGGAFRPVTQEAANAAVRAALDAGINFFDTAPYYGATAAESALGRALREIPRENFVLATKVGRYGHGPEGFDFSGERTARSVDESLARLRCDYLDLVQVHDIEFGFLAQVWNETLPALDRLRQTGKVRHLGITGFPLAALQRVREQAPALVEVVLSYCHGTLQDGTFRPWATELRTAKVGTLNAAPLAMGLLTRASMPAWHPASPALRTACAAAADYCVRRGADLAELALQHSFGLAEMDCTVVGLGSADEVSRAVKCVGRTPDPELLEGVRALLAPVQGATWPSGRPENN
ncbi:MAG: L-galactose dehydrogenase [Verrucomicrobia bacterium]|nr:L-galactose dehydrogenase [Verrucomicrobiota bacterium]